MPKGNRTVLIVDTAPGSAQMLHDVLILDSFDAVAVSHLGSVVDNALDILG